MDIILAVTTLIVALAIHEFSHALAAEYLGDPTARLKGRLTLNPIAHLDLAGSIMFAVTLYTSLTTGISFIFGWGKPVPVDPYNLQNPRKDSALIALAGPASNLFTGLILAIFIRIIFALDIVQISDTLLPFFFQLMNISVFLAIFNLIPVHPLDGGKILIGILPQTYAAQAQNFLSRYGTILLVILLFTNAIRYIITPISNLILMILSIIATLGI